MTNQQILSYHGETVAKLFNTYGINSPVNIQNLETALVSYPSFSQDLFESIGAMEPYENANGKRATRQANRKQKKTDKANGIRTPKKKGKPLFAKKPKTNSKNTATSTVVQNSKDTPEVDGSINTTVQNTKDETNYAPVKKSLGEVVQQIGDTAGIVANGVSGIIGAFKGEKTKDEQSEYTQDYKNTKDISDIELQQSFMDKYKKYWYIPVIAVGVIVVAVIVLKKRKKSA